MSETVAARPHLFPRIDGAGEHAARGYAEGYAAGLRAAVVESARRLSALEAAAAERRRRDDESTATALAALDAAASAWSARVVQQRESVERALAETAVELAAAIVGSAALDLDAAARAAIDRVLAHEESPRLTAVRLHPDDLALVASLLEAGSAPPLVGDPRVRRGDAVGDFVDGELDARLTTALDRCRALLAEGGRA
ncbi:FliH/SctL family protein [Microcella daejeonensis]|uniref:FliH/SctL family protein n=1 Tax=Microcella daejeonensis TaxID=2994971 RepID=UPI00226E3CE2|nr:FliH/SctL family protein [Microcella daejeonensis]WAB83889.1 FliH/SctL family protein [Microcella daejeonensis]